jgi:hypothetical protein
MDVSIVAGEGLIMVYESFPPSESLRGSSSIAGTEFLRSQLPRLFDTYQIYSMFDAGAGDCAWQAVTMLHMVQYYAGEGNPNLVNQAKHNFPTLNIRLHDITQDSLPEVDLLFVRDVAIHLDNQQKKSMLNNWLDSKISWLLTTQLDYTTKNNDIDLNNGQFPFAEINWHLPPWNFPTATDQILEMPGGTRLMCLWHRNQIKELL